MNPISINTRPIAPLAPAAPVQPAAPAKTDDFSGLLKRELERVNTLQQDADRSVESLISGESQSISDVFTAARKAQVAFSLLMEIRNKLADAYTEIKQLRV